MSRSVREEISVEIARLDYDVDDNDDDCWGDDWDDDLPSTEDDEEDTSTPSVPADSADGEAD